MRKLAWALAAVGCMATAFAVGSSLVATAGPAGNAAALATSPVAQNAARQVADRFPGESERFRVAGMIHPSDRGFLGAIAHANSGRVNVPGCSPWPFVAADCLTTHAKARAAPPSQPAQPAAAPAPRTTMPIVRTHEVARTPAAVPPKPAAVATPAVAAPAAAAPASSAPPAPSAVSTPACKQNLATVSAKLEKALAHVKSARPSADVCAAYQQDFFIAVQAREVTAMCKSGAERDQDLGRIDLAVEDINGAIAQSCGG